MMLLSSCHMKDCFRVTKSCDVKYLMSANKFMVGHLSLQCVTGNVSYLKKRSKH